jgi:hypothetical protein
MRLYRCRWLQRDAAIGQMQVSAGMRSGSAWSHHLQLQRGANFKANIPFAFCGAAFRSATRDTPLSEVDLPLSTRSQSFVANLKHWLIRPWNFRPTRRFTSQYGVAHSTSAPFSQHRKNPAGVYFPERTSHAYHPVATRSASRSRRRSLSSQRDLSTRAKVVSSHVSSRALG